MDWWKAPVLQGEDNDYGDYDYLIEELPEDYAKWEADKYRWKCDTCGKDRHVRFVSVHHFRTLDGWDSMSYSECWRCRLVARIHNFNYKIKNGIKRRVRAFKYALKLYRPGRKTKSFKHWYDLMMSIERKSR